MPEQTWTNTRLNKGIAAVLLLVALLCLVACGQEAGKEEQATPQQSPKGLALGLFVASSGLGDRGFMDTIYQGVLFARQKHDATLLMENQPPDSPDDVQAKLLQNLALQGAELVICSSSSMKTAMDRAAHEQPDVFFALLDAQAREYLPNVCSATFATEQGAFLAGALAAKMSQNKVLGIIGGMRTPAVQDFALGFEEGAKHVQPSVIVHTVYIEDRDSKTIPWNNPTTAAQLALELHQGQGADIFFPVAGASGIGVFNYVNENRLYAIGVDNDQDYLAEGRILTSVLKRLDMAVRRIVDEYQGQHLTNRNYRFTLANKGVGLSEMRYTKDLIPQEVHALLDTLRQDIIAGRIVVPSATDMKTGQVSIE